MRPTSHPWIPAAGFLALGLALFGGPGGARGDPPASEALAFGTDWKAALAAAREGDRPLLAVFR